MRVIPILILSALMMACGSSVTPTAMAPQPDWFGEGYVVVGECCDGLDCQPCVYACSLTIKQDLMCARREWQDLTTLYP